MSYDWQDSVFRVWRDNGFKGVVKAVTSAGKTIGALKAVKKYVEYFPYDRIWVIANSKEVVAQWKAEAKNMDLDLEVYTYPTAVSKMHKFDREAHLELLPDVMILDECHCILANVWGQVMDFGIDKYLGLSATPNGSEKKLGGIIQVVGWGEATISDATVHLVKFKPDKADMDKYLRKTDTIKKYREHHPRSTYKNDPRLSMFYLQRRKLVYGFKNREEYAVNIIEKNKDRHIMVFCATHEQARSVSKKLEDKGIIHTLHLSDQQGLDAFTSGETNIVVCCKMLSTGFSYVPADVAVIISPNTTELTLIQQIGRIIRPMEDKHADAYLLIAEGTSDEEILKKQIFQREKIFIESYDDVFGVNYELS
jgi:superfamily II DNA or RNA helicase